MNYLLVYLETFRASDLIDIIIVAAIFYRFLLIMQGTRAFQMLIGLTTVGIFYAISIQYEFYALNSLLKNFFDYLFIIIIILFQDSIRSALVSFGETKWFRFSKKQSMSILEEVVDVCEVLSRERTGAIIVFERSNGLYNYAKTGTLLDCKIHSDVLYSFFQHSSPLHDGAVILFNQRIQAAGCFLPLSKNIEIDRHLGTRHRAALGLTEVSDAVVVVVSEETGKISIFFSGQFIETKDVEDLRSRLRNILSLEESSFKFDDVRVK
jgi:diadenylate cyclase